MASRSFRSSRRTASPKRKMVWARFRVTGAAIAGAGNFAWQPLSSFESSYGATLIGCTVVRMRGSLSAVAQVAGAEVRTILAAGVFPSNITSALIDPAARPQDDWMYYDYLLAQPPIATEWGNEHRTFDIRSQRKIEELGDDLWFAASNLAGGAMTLSFGVSVLLKLP